MEKNNEQLQKKIDFQLSTFLIPPRYSDPLISWDMLEYLTVHDRQYAKDFIECFPDNKKESIWLSGDLSGTGKTSVAFCIVLDLIRAGKLGNTPLFVSFRILLENMRQNRVGSFLENSLFRKILRASFIIFDDVGLETVTESVADRYILLIEQLWLRKKRAIFTSKSTLNAFLNRGAAIVDKKVLDSIGSRLVGMCDEYVIENVRDYRND